MTVSRSTSILAEVALRLVVPDGGALPVHARLRYDTGDPYAVHVAFQTGGAEDDTEVVWTFARQLLADGLETAAGIGDVRVWPWTDQGASVVAIALSSPSGQALFEAPRDALAHFLRRTYAEVAPGMESEHVDLDFELATLLWDQRP